MLVETLLETRYIMSNIYKAKKVKSDVNDVTLLNEWYQAIHRVTCSQYLYFNFNRRAKLYTCIHVAIRNYYERIQIQAVLDGGNYHTPLNFSPPLILVRG